MTLATVNPETVAELTPIQARRLAARLQGASLTAIAKAEGCKKQSVAETLAAPKVKEAVLTILGRPVPGWFSKVERDENGRAKEETRQSVDLVMEALLVLANAMVDAKRVVVHSHGYVWVEDWPTRLAAVSRLLSLVDKP